MQRDPVTQRVNELVTTAMDTAAILGVCAGLALVLAPLAGWGAGVGAGAFLLGALSMATQYLHRERPAAPAAGRPQPGPSDPGNVHVMGR